MLQKKQHLGIPVTGRQRPTLAEHIGSFDVAEGAVLSGGGVLVIVASLRSNPAKATGIDAAVKTLGQAPLGRMRC
jgi:hypothetical protein